MNAIPRPLIGGSWARCPESRPEGIPCGWRKRLAQRGLARYRRHWLRRHA